jgi:hypothetical protein
MLSLGDGNEYAELFQRHVKERSLELPHSGVIAGLRG